MHKDTESGVIHMEKAGTRFFVGPDADKRDFPDTENVKVVTLPGGVVISIGATGSYSEGNSIEAQNRLRTWLQQNAEYRVNGPAPAVYWNGPFTPWSTKRSEVHLPFAPAGA